MALAKITCVGFEYYLRENGKSLFDEAVFPPGINKEDLIDRILLRAGEFEVLYSNPDFMTGAIGTWSKSFYHTFDRWLKALETEYSPLENYNRTEIWTDKTDSTTGTEASGTDTGKVSAYDSNTFVNKDLSESSSEGTTTVDGTNTHEGHLYGNIGVTTSQEMLKQELDIARFNLFDQIADLFIKEFCICVY